jgi:hypothetical protein
MGIIIASPQVRVESTGSPLDRAADMSMLKEIRSGKPLEDRPKLLGSEPDHDSRHLSHDPAPVP